MRACGSCRYFFPIPEDEDDYESGKGDCVTEKKDEKGRFWLSKPVYETTVACNLFEIGYRIKISRQFLHLIFLVF